MIDSDDPSVRIRVRLLGPFHVERRREDGNWEAIKKTVWGNSSARALFKRLLGADNRRATGSQLLAELWPRSSARSAEHYLNHAVCKLRKIFQWDELITAFTSHGRVGYQLSDQALVWCDIDACEALIIEAERLGRASTQAFSLLKQARSLFDRGSMLEEESAAWSLAIRAEKEKLESYCRIWLAEAYEVQGESSYARMQYLQLLERNPRDEDVLCRLLGFLYRQGKKQEAISYYEEVKQYFDEHGLSLSKTTQKLVELIQEEHSYLNRSSFKATEETNKVRQSSLMPRALYVDLIRFQSNLPHFWQFYYASTALDFIFDIQATIEELRILEQQVSRGGLQQLVWDLLFSYYLLAARIAHDLRSYGMATNYQNEALNIAKSIDNLSLWALALSERGFTQLVWGSFGETDTLGAFQAHPKRIIDAVADLEGAIPYAQPQLKGLITLDLSRAMGMMKRSETDITRVLSTVEQAEQWIGQEQRSDDLYARICLPSPHLQHWRLYLGQAVTFNVVGHPAKAVAALQAIKQLAPGEGLPANEIRRNAWAMIIEAEAHMGLQSFDQAATLASTALRSCQDIQSLSNIAIIRDIYSRLRQGSASNHVAVIELGKTLATSAII